MTEDGSITVEARAKVNLTLEILGTRQDGYHELRSIVMPVSLADTVELTKTNGAVALTVGIEPGINATELGPAERNLAVRAALLLKARYGVRDGVRIRIQKRIPVGGGLGGGSADAAAVIRGLNRLWGLSRPEEELVVLAAELGSDIPALVLGGAVLMEGRGERVQRLAMAHPAPGFPIILANPGVHCSTPEVFRRWKGDLTSMRGIVHTMAFSIRTGDVRGAAGALFNGLQPAAFEGYPAVAGVAALLRECGCLGVLLSGSGATVFGLVADAASGRMVCRRLEAAGVWHVMAQTCPMV
ncbi:MAG: 4-(cytidine 5'-diphospho)-2-C-methyl-D-erythritol kinase [Kiritimatiellae bacterium]|nr:4-(cytidine 5'-diphospho)-2-C-methyl-D-erythritol kinase [Kiritimatiellia bacterium]